MMSRIAAVLMPAAVFQSVIVGGAYGTGREVAEFISRFGPWGGLGVLALAALGFGLVLAVSFELARLERTYDYRSFLRVLLGRGWFLYEGLFICLLVIVLAVTGAAAGEVLADTFEVPATLGTGLMLGSVVVLAYAGRSLVEVTLTAGAVILTGVILAVAWRAWTQEGAAIAESFRTAPTLAGWPRSAFVFMLYNSALVPVLLYVAAPLNTRREAFTAGALAGCAGILPGLLFHLAFMSAYPAIIEQEIPTHWLLQRLDHPLLLTVYLCALCMTIIQTGVGVLHGVLERLDNAWRERCGVSLSPLQHSAIAGGAMLASLGLAQVGIVDLVARGYGSLAWGFLLVYTLPVLTLGIARIVRAGRPA